MSQWSSVKARRLLSALLRIGWRIERESGGSHKILSRDGWQNVVFAFHDGDEVGPRMLSKIAKTTGLKPEDL
jgi:predicted RNA binding protein YcfA (HicA-like mRNA interferase family)